MERYILGIDNGGSVTKAALYRIDGTMVAVESQPVISTALHPSWSERDMLELWRANVAVIRRVVESSGIDSREICMISLTGHGNGIYLVDEVGAPVRAGIISNDGRASPIVKRWIDDGSYSRYCFDKSMQSLFSGGPLPIMKWLDENEPGVCDRTAYVVMAKDYIRYMMSGVMVAEATDMSCTNLYDMNTREASPSMLEDMGLGKWAQKLPPVVQSSQVCATVLPAVAAMTGLAAGTPICGGTSDIAGAAIGTGAVQDRKLSIVTGTWSINNYFDSQPVVDPELFVCTESPMPGQFLITEGSPTSASNLEWFVNQVLKKLPGYQSKSNGELYEVCNGLAFSEDAEKSSIVFTPYVFGSYLHPGAPGAWVNVTNADSLTQLVRAIYEGVAFSHREHIDRLRGFAKVSDSARITGGVTNSAPWMKLFADVLHIPLEVVDVKEGGILGAVMVGAVASGDYRDVLEAAEAMVPEPTVIEPDPATYAMYDEKYRMWLETAVALQD